MALSPQYGWSEPDNSSLVKNGAADIRTLGDAIDTSLWNVGFGQAGKNKLINANFAFNQRSFTSLTLSGSLAQYGFDRWRGTGNDGTVTYTPQTFTAGAAPVAGYEAVNYARLVTSGQTLTSAIGVLGQPIEDVRTFAGQTVTVSFWAKAATGTPKIAVELDQQFGSGGSTRVTTYAGQVTLSTAWVRYSVSVPVPSISGKTIGTNSSLVTNLFVSAGSDFNSRTGSLGIQSNTFDFWGVQVEYGSKATPFQTASGGSQQAELAMCQRYYQKYSGDGNAFMNGTYYSTTAFYGVFTFPIMRVAPTTTTPATALNVFSGGSTRASTTVFVAQISTSSLEMQGTTSAATAGAGAWVRFNTGGQIELSAEL